MPYETTKVFLSDGQMQKLRAAQNKQEECTLMIDTSKPANASLQLTKTQINQLKQGKRIKLSKTQLKQTGGFLPLAVLGPLIARGAVAGLASLAAQKVAKKITGSGKKKRGKGVYQPWQSATI